jgi:hypothetical protein
MDVSALQGFASLLGGYMKGKQSQLNRSIKAAQLKRELDRDAAAATRHADTVRHQMAMERIGLLNANRPEKIDTGPSTMFETAIKPVRDFWTNWHETTPKLPTTTDRVRHIESAFAALPAHRQIIQAALDQHGKSLGYGNLTADDFLNPMHRFSPYVKVTKDANGKDIKSFDTEKIIDQFGPQEIPKADLDMLTGLTTRYAQGDVPLGVQAKQIGDLKKDWIQRYGKKLADKYIPLIPGETYETGGVHSVAQFGQPTTFDPAKQGTFPAPNFNHPLVGEELPDNKGIGRLTYPDAAVQSVTGMDKPGPYADSDVWKAWGQKPGNMVDGPAIPFYMPGNRFYTFPGRSMLSKTRQFADNVINGRGRTQEEIGLQTYIGARRRVNDSFNPFDNVNDMRTALAELPPHLAPTLHALADELVNSTGTDKKPLYPGTQEYVSRTVTQEPNKEVFSFKPNASAEQSVSATALNKARVNEINTILPLREADIKMDILNKKDTIFDRSWQRQFNEQKEKISNAFKQANYDLDAKKFDYEQYKFKVDRKIREHKIGQDDVTFVQGLGKVQQDVVDGMLSELRSADAALSAARTAYNMNGGAVGAVPAGILKKWADGTITADEKRTWLSGSVEQSAANLWADLQRAQTRQTEAFKAHRTETEKLDSLIKWEKNVQDEFTGVNLIKSTWRKYDKTILDDALQIHVDNMELPPGYNSKGEKDPKITKSVKLQRRQLYPGATPAAGKPFK